MTISTKRAGLAVAVAALIGVSACANKGTPADASLQKDLAAAAGKASDLELAPKSGAQMVVSAIEGGPSATPAPAPRKIASKPSPRPAPQVVSPHKIAPVATPVPRSTVVEVAPLPAPKREPAPLPARAQEPPPLGPTPGPVGRQKGTYKTEAEIFRQLPNVKP